MKGRGLPAAILIVLMASLVPAAPSPAHGAVAGPKLQVFFAADFTDQEYQKKAYSRVASAWKMPPDLPPEGSKAVVIVRILRDGRSAEVRLHFQSGSDGWDAAAVAAVKDAGPFAPLPREYGRDSVEAHFHFIYSE
jgi:protein TonB